jgi:bifunctional non-homologous end joining protein LigD
MRCCVAGQLPQQRAAAAPQRPTPFANPQGTRIKVQLDDFDGLLGLVEIGAIELHTWNSTIDDLEYPDQMVFDLDPGQGVSSTAFTYSWQSARAESLSHTVVR